jgi:hypothetical protein
VRSYPDPCNWWTVLIWHEGWVTGLFQHCPPVVSVCVTFPSLFPRTMPPGAFLRVHALRPPLLPHQGPPAHPPLLVPRLHPTRDAFLACERPSPSRDRFSMVARVVVLGRVPGGAAGWRGAEGGLRRAPDRSSGLSWGRWCL